MRRSLHCHSVSSTRRSPSHVAIFERGAYVQFRRVTLASRDSHPSFVINSPVEGRGGLRNLRDWQIAMGGGLAVVLRGEPFFRYQHGTSPFHQCSASMVMLTIRLMMLLNDLSARHFQPPPCGVGLKTIVIARGAGLIEIEGQISGRPLCRLTRDGKLYRNKHGIRF